MMGLIPRLRGMKPLSLCFAAQLYATTFNPDSRHSGVVNFLLLWRRPAATRALGAAARGRGAARQRCSAEEKPEIKAPLQNCSSVMMSPI